MREYKFRGKSKKTGEWVYGYFFKDFNGKCYIINTLQRIENANKDNVWVEVLEETVGQYTGLHDKDGKEIYEGDIVRTKYMDKTFIVWVEYSDEYAEFVTKCKEILFFDEPLSDIGRADREVIGNIYDNPELLEEDYNV